MTASCTDLSEFTGSGFADEHAHVARLQFDISGGSTGSTSGGTATTSGGVGGSDGTFHSNLIVINPPPTTSTTSGGTTATTSGGSGGGTDTVHNYFMIERPAGTTYPSISIVRTNPAPLAASFTITDTTVTGHPSFATSGYEILPGDRLFVRLDGATGGRIKTFLVRVENITTWQLDANGNPINVNSTLTSDYVRTDYSVDRAGLTTVSIDSRKAFGQPTIDGELPSDPNAESRNVNFHNWIYKGGLFLGNVQGFGSDLSGISRIQTYLNNDTARVDPVLCTLTLTHLGGPSAFSGQLKVHAFKPLATDANYGSSPSDVTWSTGWSLVGSVRGASVTLPDSYPANEYVNLGSPGVDHIGVALDDETTSRCWRYFASQKYQEENTALGFPTTDSAPRLWICTFAFGSAWETVVHTP